MVLFFCSKLQVRETKGIGRSALVPYWCCAMHDEVGLDLEDWIWTQPYEYLYIQHDFSSHFLLAFLHIGKLFSTYIFVDLCSALNGQLN